MMLEAIVFIVAFFGLIALFALKRWESGRGQIIFPGIRSKADDGARNIKSILLALLWYGKKLPRILVALTRLGVHVTAVTFGHLAHYVGEKSHALADFVSYKHRFERRETRSEFLRQVIEHPITNRTAPSVAIPPRVNEEIPVRDEVTPEIATPTMSENAPEALPETPVVKKKPARRRRILSRKKLEIPVDNGQDS